MGNRNSCDCEPRLCYSPPPLCPQPSPTNKGVSPKHTKIPAPPCSPPTPPPEKSEPENIPASCDPCCNPYCDAWCDPCRDPKYDPSLDPNYDSCWYNYCDPCSNPSCFPEPECCDCPEPDLKPLPTTPRSPPPALSKADSEEPPLVFPIYSETRKTYLPCPNPWSDVPPLVCRTSSSITESQGEGIPHIWPLVCPRPKKCPPIPKPLCPLPPHIPHRIIKDIPATCIKTVKPMRVHEKILIGLIGLTLGFIYSIYDDYLKNEQKKMIAQKENCELLIALAEEHAMVQKEIEEMKATQKLMLKKKVKKNVENDDW